MSIQGNLRKGQSLKSLFFDTGPIISLVMSRLVGILPELKKEFGGKFYITPAVKKELVERPLQIKRFGFEALQVMKLLREGTLELYEDVPQRSASSLIKLANSSFRIDGKMIDVIQSGEIESVAAALPLAAGVVMDERTLRLFIENNKEMKSLLESRFQKDVVADEEKMNAFSEQLRGVKIIRSIELVGLAYRRGFLDGYIPPQKDGRSVLLDALLWAVKSNGCAVTTEEIEEIKDYLLRGK